MNFDEEASTRRCKVDECARRHKGHGFCELHMRRWLKYGDPLAGGRPQTLAYRTIHNRLKAKRGAASSHQCADCGERADHWSYDGSDPDELTSKDGRGYELTYSADLSTYQPRCARCHHLFDHPANPTCPSGHDMDEENTWIDNRGGRVCRRCKAERLKRWKQSKKVAS